MKCKLTLARKIFRFYLSILEMGRGLQRNHFFEFLKFKGIDPEEKPEMILCLNVLIVNHIS